MHALDQSHQRVLKVRRRGFSMTELLVVIGIIAILAGVLLVALGGVRTRAKHTQTLSTMTEFAGACEAFQIEHGQYPGVIPDTVLAAEAGSGSIQISGTENALLHLMGGYQVKTPYGLDGADPSLATEWACDEGAGIICATYASGDWELRIDINRIGEGPVINGKPYAPYYTPTESAVGVAKGQWKQVMTANIKLPDLLDAWGQPIIYVRRARTVGPLVGTYAPGAGPPAPPQFYYEPFEPYVNSIKLGELGKSQTDMTDGSILTSISNPGPHLEISAQMLRHSAFGDRDAPLTGTARGGFVLLSAGPDGVYFSKADGPGAPKDGKHIGEDPDFDEFLDFGPDVFNDFDDVRVFGGG